MRRNSQLRAKHEGNINTCVMPSLTRPEGSVCIFLFFLEMFFKNQFKNVEYIMESVDFIICL